MTTAFAESVAVDLEGRTWVRLSAPAEVPEHDCARQRCDSNEEWRHGRGAFTCGAMYGPGPLTLASTAWSLLSRGEDGLGVTASEMVDALIARWA